MAQWIFFDVGNVLLNDDPVMAAVFRHIWLSIREKGHEIGFEEIMHQREEISDRSPKRRIHHEVALQYLTPLEWKQTRRRYLDETLPVLDRYCPPIPGMPEAVRQWESRANLGLIANQPKEIVPVLERLNLWDLFQVQGISQQVGLSKPDPEFYRWALGQAGCDPEQAIMIGDTVKYDILPARSLGMKTLWFAPHPDDKGYQARDEFEAAYLESLRRQYPSRMERVSREVQPDAIARNAKELSQGIAELLDRMK
jgi:HAD superfamily hydrolase (TIGR01509 family)